MILLRGGAATLEVLLVQRSADARFMAGAWVFPGGAVNAGEQELADAHGRAARRELREEAGIELAADAELIEFSRWITPERVKTRFDTRFFLAELPEGQTVAVDGEECVDHRWLAPSTALSAEAEQELLLVFPTIKQLERLARYGTVAQLLADARSADVPLVQPKVVIEGGQPTILLPGERGY